MSRLMIRSPGGSWLNICESEWYVRNNNQGWTRLSPNKGMKVRHGGNTYWLDVTCDEDYPVNCPPEDEVLCFPGYTGNFDGGILDSSKNYICDCDGNNCVTYSNQSILTTVNQAFEGSYEKPFPCPATFYGGKAVVTEFWAELGQISGMAHLSAVAVNTDIRIRVYKGCKLVADSNAETNLYLPMDNVATHALSWFHDTIDGNGIVLVRIDAPSSSALWEVSFTCPNSDFIFNATHPATYGTFKVLTGCDSALERYHRITAAGIVYLDLNFSTLVKVSVYYQGSLLAYTQDFVFGHKVLSFKFSPKNGDYHVLLRFDADGASDGEYSLYAPNQKGSFWNPQSCGNSVNATGSGLQDTWFNLEGQPDGKIKINFDPGDKPSQILVYYNNQLVASTKTTTVPQTISFMYAKNNGTYVNVRVITECCSSWSYSFACSLPKPTVSIGDTSVIRGPYGTSKNLCFPVTLSSAYDENVTVNYSLQSLAIASNDCTQRTATPSPFLVVPIVNSLFQTWARTAGDLYYPANSVWSGDAASWSFKNDTIITSIGSNGIIGFISPVDVDNYVAEFTVGSSDNDNGVIGGILAFARVDGKNHYIMALRHRGSLSSNGTMAGGWASNFVLCYVTSLSQNMTIVKVLGERVVGGYGSWSGTFSRIKMDRVGNVFKAWCSDWGSDNILDETLLSYDLSNDAELSIFANKRPLGLFAIAQAKVSFENIHFTTRIGPEYTYPVPDYKPIADGVLIFAPGETSKEICVEVCGTDRVGPTRTVLMNIFNPVNSTIIDDQGIGSIINPNVVDCAQDANLPVKNGGASNYVQNGARNMHVQDLLTDANQYYSAFMVTDLYIPADGTYTFVLHGDDIAELYVDCELILTNSLLYPTSVRYWVPAGNRRIHIVYTNTFGPQKSAAYAAMAVLKADGSVLYRSDASHWRGGELVQGNAPTCVQFAVDAPFNNLINVTYIDGRENLIAALTPYGAKPIGPNPRPDDNWTTSELVFNFPYTGSYRIELAVDDRAEVIIDCKSIVYNEFIYNSIASSIFSVKQGESRIIVRCFNQSPKKPNWFIFVIFDENDNVVYATEATGWKNRLGDIDTSSGWR